MPSIILAAIGGITTHFHEDIRRGFPHNGIDQGHGGGTPAELEIKAPADGVVIAHGWFGSYGNRLVIKHDDGWTSLLAHHEWQGVKTGDRVQQGTPIAVMGNTGTVYVHNHQELRLADGTQVDPLLHLTTSTAGSCTTPLENDMMPIDMLTAQIQVPGRAPVQVADALAAIYIFGEAEQADSREIKRISNENWALIRNIQERPSSAIDTVKLAAELAKLNVTVDTAALVKALDASLNASLADNFAAIPGAVVSGLKAAL